MEKALNTFTYNFDPDYFGQPVSMDIRVIDQEGNPWFIGKDVATLLGYSNPPKAIKDHCKNSISFRNITKVNDSFTLHPATKLIPESDLYRLIMRSDMEEAERFQDWVCEEILPTIRKTGGTYMSPEHAEKVFTDPDFIIGMATQIKKLQMDNEHLNKTKHQISRNREAVTMQRLGAERKKTKRLLRENAELRDGYDDPMYLEAKAIKWIPDLFIVPPGDQAFYQILGRKLSSLSKSMGYDVHHRKSGRYANGIGRYDPEVISCLFSQAKTGDCMGSLNDYLKVPEFA